MVAQLAITVAFLKTLAKIKKARSDLGRVVLGKIPQVGEWSVEWGIKGF